MFPIYLQRRDSGLGMGYDEFVGEFRRLCGDHLTERRAQAFCFVFYDASDGAVRAALKGADGFRILNEATGENMTLFYLHDSAAERLTQPFNRRFLRALGVSSQIVPPCIVFFEVCGNDIEDVSIHRLDELSDEPHMLVEEMRRTILKEIAARGQRGDISGLDIVSPVIPFLRFMKELATLG